MAAKMSRFGWLAWLVDDSTSVKRNSDNICHNVSVQFLIFVIYFIFLFKYIFLTLYIDTTFKFG